MTDLAAKKVWKTRPRSGRDSFPIANGVTAYEGMLVGIEGGYANHWADGANDIFAGICLRGDDRAKDGVLTGNTSDTPPPELTVDTSGVVLMHMVIAGTPTQAKVGDYVYSADSNPTSITLNSSGRTHPIGIMSRYRSATDVDVTLFSMMDHAVQAIA